MFRQRVAGVLLPLPSLPGPAGMGDLGPAAFDFADRLGRAGQRLWQWLPIHPTGPESDHCPYTALSAFAGNEWLISPEGLFRDGWLNRRDLPGRTAERTDRIDIERVRALKGPLLERAFQRFCAGPRPEGFEAFRREQAGWLEDYSLFVVLRRRLGGRPWTRWPVPLRDRHARALAAARRDHAEDLLRVQFLQYCVARQLSALRRHCHDRRIQLVGDLPIYVAHDSADVWSHRHLFKLDRDGRPAFKAGVPPDYFSRSGQLWGNPVYDWSVAARDDYTWFCRRVAHELEQVDWLRIDHFRGLVAYWEVPGRHRTARRGHWAPGPGTALLEALWRRCPAAGLLAEDLGDIDAEVREVIRRYRLPGMKVLQFGFAGPPGDNPHAPHAIEPNSVVYTGTHDNNTTRGWFDQDLDDAARRRLADVLGHRPRGSTVAWDLVRLAHHSVARAAVIPMQDLLNLGPEARLNTPGTSRGNWRWRLRPGLFSQRLIDRLGHLTELSGRL